MSESPLTPRLHPSLVPVEPEDRVRRTVRQVNALCKDTTLRFALSVGQLVVKGLYDGDTRRLRSRGRKDQLALRRLAADPDLAMSASALYRSVAIFELCERVNVAHWKHVSTSHLRLVLPLRPSDQERFLRETEANRWKVRELEQRIAAVGDDARVSARGGRPRRSGLRSVVDLLEKGTERVVGLLSSNDQTTESSPESVRATVDALGRMRDACDALEERVVAAARQSGISVKKCASGDDSPGRADDGGRAGRREASVAAASPLSAAPSRSRR